MELNWYSYGPPPPDPPPAVTLYAVLSAATVGLMMNTLQLSVILLAAVFRIPEARPAQSPTDSSSDSTLARPRMPASTSGTRCQAQAGDLAGFGAVTATAVLAERRAPGAQRKTDAATEAGYMARCRDFFHRGHANGEVLERVRRLFRRAFAPAAGSAAS